MGSKRKLIQYRTGLMRPGLAGLLLSTACFAVGCTSSTGLQVDGVSVSIPTPSGFLPLGINPRHFDRRRNAARRG